MPKGLKKTSPKRVWNLCFIVIILKMLNLLKHMFYYRNTMFFEGTAVRKMNKTWKTHAKNRCLKNVRKLLVIWFKNGSPKGHLKCSKAHVFRHIFACYFWNGFGIIAGRKWMEHGSNKGVQNVTKNHEKSIPSPGWFWTEFWWFLSRCLKDFSLIWDRFSTDVDTMFTRILGQQEPRENCRKQHMAVYSVVYGCIRLYMAVYGRIVLLETSKQ